MLYIINLEYVDNDSKYSKIKPDQVSVVWVKASKQTGLSLDVNNDDTTRVNTTSTLHTCV